MDVSVDDLLLMIGRLTVENAALRTQLAASEARESSAGPANPKE
jgi:hypothetical protein